MASSERLHAEVEIESLSQERRGPGLSLRQARERARLTVASVADTLHLEQRVIEALETDDYSRLPPITYVRGYIRAYANLVSLPVADVLRAFERVGLEERSRPLTSKVGSTGGRRLTGSPMGSSWLLTAAFAAVLISGWMFWTQGEPTPGDPHQDADAIGEAGAGSVLDHAAGGPDAEAAASTAVPAILEVPAKTRIELPGLNDETPAMTAPPLAEPPQSSLNAIADETARNVNAVPIKATQQDPPGAAAVSGAAAVADRKAAGSTATTTHGVPESISPQLVGTLERLKIDTTGKSWVDVRDAGGQRLVYGLLERGDSRQVTGQPPFDITIGDTTQVALRHNGARVDLGRYTRGKVARFTLTATRD